MNYLAWSFLALASYTLYTPLVKLATNDVPSDVVALVTNSILTLSALGLVLYRDQRVVPHLTGRTALYMVGAGVFLSIGILAYYRALDSGPLSVVIPIFGMFIVTSSLLGIVLLDESFTLRKAAGLVLAVGTVYLTATG